MNASTVLAEVDATKRQTRESKNASFISKMHQILQDPNCTPFIDWNPEGTAFQISSSSDFSNAVLPKYFKHSNYSSFVRQLNMYGFRKVKTETAESSFSHEMFKKDEATLHKIKRLKLRKNQSDDEDDEHFIEKYSGPRSVAVAKNQTQNLEYKNIQEQLSQLTGKFKTMQESTEELKKTISSQNNNIKNLMSELLQLRTEGEKKFKSLLAELVSVPQTNDSYVDQQERFLMNNVDLKNRVQNPAVLSSTVPQNIPSQKINPSQRVQNSYYSNRMDNSISITGGWNQPDSYLNVNYAQAQAAPKKAKSSRNFVSTASKESFTTLYQPANANTYFDQGKTNSGVRSYGNEVNTPYPYLEQTYQSSEERPTNSFAMNPFEVQGNYPELAFEDQEDFENDYFRPYKKVQKVSLRNDGYPVFGEMEQIYH